MAAEQAAAVPAPLNQQALFDALIAAHPDILTKSVYRPMSLPEPLYKMPLREKHKLFMEALHGMLQEIRDGRDIIEVVYNIDADRPRLWSFGLQPMWEVCASRQESKLLGTESLLALHTGSWGVGLVLDVLDHLLNSDLEGYLQFKGMEIEAVVQTLKKYPGLPYISVNLRPSEWLMPEVRQLVLDATRRAPGRAVFELTEYTEDEHFARLFGKEGSLAEGLTKTLLPVLRDMKEQGVTLVADDLMPGHVYHFADAAARRNGRRLVDSHATEFSVIMSKEWAGVFHGVKINLDWVIHAMSITKDTTGGADYGRIMLFAKGVKDNPGHVAAVLDSEVPAEESDQLMNLQRLQQASKAALQEALCELRRRPFSIPVVFEGTLPPGAPATWGLDGDAKAQEQGGLLFEARLPPWWYFAGDGATTS